MNTAQINGDGQVTIPADIREQLGLLPGTEVQLEVINGTLQLHKVSTVDRGEILIQQMRGKATSRLKTDEIMQITRADE